MRNTIQEAASDLATLLTNVRPDGQYIDPDRTGPSTPEGRAYRMQVESALVDFGRACAESAVLAAEHRWTKR